MTWITTGDGAGRFDFQRPLIQDVDPLDIVRSLSRTARFRGMGREFYSVGQHSLLVGWLALLDGGHTDLKTLQRYGFSCDKSNYAFRLFQLALLHDAVETYINDLPQPLKPLLPAYEALERRLEPIVLSRFGIEHVCETEVAALKKADLQACLIERDYLFPANRGDWGIEEGASPYTFNDFFTRGWQPNVAEEALTGLFGSFFPWLGDDRHVH
jgi:5'-deoxynucleotidase YfbR-like HD superfamily hydrolase